MPSFYNEMRSKRQAREADADARTARAKLAAIREIAAEPINRYESDKMRLDMILRICDRA